MSEVETGQKSPSRNERRKAATRAKLLSAARVVIAEKGLVKATIKDITDAADVGFGSFYNHFQTKEDIAEAVLKEVAHELADAADAFNQTIEDPMERLGAAMAGFCRMVVADPVLSQLILNVVGFNSETSRDLSARMLPDLEMGMKQGVFKLPNLEVTRTAIFGLLLHFLQGRLAGHLDESDNEHAVLMGLRILGVTDDKALPVARKYTMLFGDGTQV